MINTHQSKQKIAQVIVPLPVFEFLDYKIPVDASYAVGDYVKIPIGNRFEIGIITVIKNHSDFKKLKYITEKYNLIPLNHNILTFIQKVSAYTISPIGDVLKAVLRGFSSNNCEFHTDFIILGDITKKRISLQRQEIIDFLQQHSECQASLLRQQYSASIIRDMIKIGQLSVIKKQKIHCYKNPDIDFNIPSLSDEQKNALTIFKQEYKNQDFIPYLLDGITGSGKTELYMEMMAFIWQQQTDAQILILIPEIGLVEQTVTRFEKRFGSLPAIWHSQINETTRKIIRDGIVDGSIRCIIGARSGLFLPFQNLKMIVVDEEHDNSYKQEEGFRYHARDMAVMRSQIEKIPIILASATPSLETYVNAEIGRYHKLQLRHRFNSVLMPKIHLIDLKQNQPTNGNWISPILAKAIEKTACLGEQSLLFLNRRGYAPLMLCKGCGYRIECPFCSAWVVYHKQYEFLKCHQCGQQSHVPSQCGSCGASDTFSPCGPGVERLFEEVQSLFPHLKSVILSSDYQENSKKLNLLLEQIKNGDIHILIGTQMIAKGHHFPYLTCVGIIDADLGLKGGDFRAFERSFQMLEQVSGRAGRETKQGNVYVQTYNPQHPVMMSLQDNDRENFLEQEVENRLQAEYPPFGRLVALIISSEHEKKLLDFCRLMLKQSPQDKNISIFGPAPAPIFMLRGRYRYRFLLKTTRKILPQAYIKEWLSKNNIPNDIKIHIDVDPINFL